jgi:hypothetical protein
MPHASGAYGLFLRLAPQLFNSGFQFFSAFDRVPSLETSISQNTSDGPPDAYSHDYLNDDDIFDAGKFSGEKPNRFTFKVTTNLSLTDSNSASSAANRFVSLRFVVVLYQSLMRGVNRFAAIASGTVSTSAATDTTKATLLASIELPHFFAARTFAQRARWAAAIRFLPAADILCARLIFVLAPPSNRCNTRLSFAISFLISFVIDFRLMAAPPFARCDGGRIARLPNVSESVP